MRCERTVKLQVGCTNQQKILIVLFDVTWVVLSGCFLGGGSGQKDTAAARKMSGRGKRDGQFLFVLYNEKVLQAVNSAFSLGLLYNVFLVPHTAYNL